MSNLDDLNNAKNNLDDLNNLNDLSNTDLLEKLESAAIDYITIVKEAILRIGSRQFSEEELQKFIGIGERMGVQLIDFVSTGKANTKDDIKNTKEVMKSVISEVIDKAYDKNR